MYPTVRGVILSSSAIGAFFGVAAGYAFNRRPEPELPSYVPDAEKQERAEHLVELANIIADPAVATNSAIDTVLVNLAKHDERIKTHAAYKNVYMIQASGRNKMEVKDLFHQKTQLNPLPPCKTDTSYCTKTQLLEQLLRISLDNQ